MKPVLLFVVESVDTRRKRVSDVMRIHRPDTLIPLRRGDQRPYLDIEPCVIITLIDYCE